MFVFARELRRHPRPGATNMSTIVIPGLRHLTDDRRRFGFRKAAAGLFYRVAQRLVKLRINELMSRPMAGIDLLDTSPECEKFEFRALTPSEVRAFAADPSNDLNAAMADRIEAGHDWCFAALYGERLANYSWYALGSIESLHCHVALSFPADTVYLYKAFTHRDFRGAGIHQATFVRASRWLARLGLHRVVLIVEYANWESLRSHQQLGFRKLGLIVTAGRGSFRFERHPCVARKLGLRFGSQADLDPRQTRCTNGFVWPSQVTQSLTVVIAPELDRYPPHFQEATG
jgi:GNAT superfamily N-acetyltransferase